MNIDECIEKIRACLWGDIHLHKIDEVEEIIRDYYQDDKTECPNCGCSEIISLEARKGTPFKYDRCIDCGCVRRQ